ncbi:MAG: gliding motility-associated C-terminal domain-containing protein [Chitinophagaceae bacterium]|nr:gliding motility-associated C-terminal domain-containing protein [Chitinophagaceae bacterium]
MSRISRTILFVRLFFLFCCSFIFLSSNAQLCIGSLGDPVVNLTFGSGANTGQGFTAPGYTYVASSCPNDGFYTITSSTSGCFGNSWHTVNADHTGNGAFLLVNASNQPADFFITTVSGLCPNTTYEFSAWIMNVLISATGIQPNLTFNIETPAGVILNTFNTGNIAVSPQPDWKQYGFFFTTTPGNPVIVLRITNNAPGGIGNDLALDDITFRPCGPVLSSSIQGSSNIVDQCINLQSNYTFDAVVSPGFLLPVYQWQVSTDSGVLWKDIPGANTLLYQRQPTPAGNYWYRLTVAESGNAGLSACRIGSNVLIINVFPKPVINAGPDRMILSGKQTLLTATSNDINNVFNWMPPDYLSSTTILNPVAAPDRDMYYSLFAVSPNGCTNEDQVFIKVVAGIFVPTAFTPNNDGKNDYWKIPYLEPMPGVSVRVYNRWGQKVYQVIGAEVNWDGYLSGIPQPAGTYVYFIHFTDGTPDMKGTVHIIR